MTTETANFLQNVCNEIGNQECEIFHDYSGRGMMGNITTGIVVYSVPLLLCDVLQYISEHIQDRSEYNGIPIPDISDFRIDNVGNRTILY